MHTEAKTLIFYGDFMSVNPLPVQSSTTFTYSNKAAFSKKEGVLQAIVIAALCGTVISIGRYLQEIKPINTNNNIVISICAGVLVLGCIASCVISIRDYQQQKKPLTQLSQTI